MSKREKDKGRRAASAIEKLPFKSEILLTERQPWMTPKPPGVSDLEWAAIGEVQLQLVSEYKAPSAESLYGPSGKIKGGRPKKEKPEHVVFGETVERFRPRFEIGKALQRDGGVSALRRDKFTPLEIDCLVKSRNPNTAAIRWACERLRKSFPTGKNYFSQFRHERHQK